MSPRTHTPNGLRAEMVVSGPSAVLSAHQVNRHKPSTTTCKGIRRCNIVNLRRLNYDWHKYDRHIRLDQTTKPVPWGTTRHNLLFQYQQAQFFRQCEQTPKATAGGSQKLFTTPEGKIDPQRLPHSQ